MHGHRVIGAAIVAVIVSSTSMAHAQLGTKPQEVLLTKIAVTDIVKSYEFYTKVIGLKRATTGNAKEVPPPSAADNAKDFIEIPMNFSGSMADPYIVLSKRKEAKPTPEFARMMIFGFKVPSVRDAMATAGAAGYKPTRDVLESGKMAFGFIEDPDGYTIEFLQAPSYPGK